MLGEEYLLTRGLPIEVAQVNGIEIDIHPDRAKVEERLGISCVPLWKFATEILWFPVYDKDHNRLSWIGRGLPTVGGKPKFVTPVHSSGIPYVPLRVWRDIGKPSNPLIITEGPVKSLVLVEAGALAIGLNGVWCASATTPEGKLLLRKEIVDLEVRGRKVCLALDADAASNPDVRHAAIRLFFLLSAAGAEVYQLTSWDESQGRGIDDYLANESKENPDQREDIVKMLMTDAQPFMSSITNSKIDLDAVESELGKIHLSTLHRDQLCSGLYKPLGVRIEVLRAVGTNNEPGGKIEVSFARKAEPWPEEVSGSDLFHDLSAIIGRHVVLSQDSLLTVALWIPVTYLCDVVEFLPILAILSPQKRCGKTRLLSVLQRLVYRAMPSVLISAAALYRSIEQYHPTLLLDEAENYLKEDVELRAIINSGHSRDTSWVPRCIGDHHKVELFSTWAPKAIAQIGKLYPTLEDRSIVINMMRRTKGEVVKPLRATSSEEFETLRRKITRWVGDNGSQIAIAKPLIPAALNDRAADNWSPLLAIAQVLGDEWPDLSTKAAIALSGPDDDEDSVVSRLLVSLRGVFKARNMVKKDGMLPTEEILKELNADKEAPWADWREGRGLSAEKLRSLLKPFGARPVRKQTKGKESRGYEFGSLKPIFDRYLSHQSDVPET